MKTITCGCGYYMVGIKTIKAVRKDKNGHLTRRSDIDIWREINIEIDKERKRPERARE